MQKPLLLFSAVFTIDDSHTPEEIEEAMRNIQRTMEDTTIAIQQKAPVRLEVKTSSQGTGA